LKIFQRIERLAKIYPTTDDIDYLVGGMLERIIPGTLTTPSFRCVLGEGFFRYKSGDRFFYEYDIAPGAFTPGKKNDTTLFIITPVYH
jgi:hypothetical protein